MSGGPEGCCILLPSFGFVSPTLLMLNDHSFYDIVTGTLRANVFPLREVVPQALHLAEGLTLEAAGR